MICYSKYSDGIGVYLKIIICNGGDSMFWKLTILTSADKLRSAKFIFIKDDNWTIYENVSEVGSTPGTQRGKGCGSSYG